MNLNKYQSPSSKFSRPDEEPWSGLHSVRFQDSVSVDLSVLQEFKTLMGDDGDEIVIEVIDLFLSDTPEKLVKMQQAIAHADSEELRKAAHSLKSSSAGVGATGLSALCQELETIGHSGKINNAQEKMLQVNIEYINTRDILNSVAKNIGLICVPA